MKEMKTNYVIYESDFGNVTLTIIDGIEFYPNGKIFDYKEWYENLKKKYVAVTNN